MDVDEEKVSAERQNAPLSPSRARVCLFCLQQTKQKTAEFTRKIVLYFYVSFISLCNLVICTDLYHGAFQKCRKEDSQENQALPAADIT